jgi:N-acylneuraminate cytidylyltransferase
MRIMTSEIVAIIPARGGSKGLTRKNIIDFCGKPLVAWSIEDAKKSKYINKVYISTDDDKITKIAFNFGAEVINRPAEISGDTATSESALMHVIKSQKLTECEYIVFLQATSPLRETTGINQAIELIKSENADSLFSSCYVGEMNLWREKNGTFASINYDYKNRLRRQDAEKVYGKQYHENGRFYIFKPKGFIENNNRLFGKIITYVQEDWKWPQIDSMNDFFVCEKVFREHLAYKLSL